MENIAVNRAKTTLLYELSTRSIQHSQPVVRGEGLECSTLISTADVCGVVPWIFPSLMQLQA
jgi:hypothetical protein